MLDLGLSISPYIIVDWDPIFANLKRRVKTYKLSYILES